MKAIDVESLLDLRQHLSIVHHVPGRVRLCVQPAIYKHATAQNEYSLESSLESVDGIDNIRINPPAASVVI